MLRQVIFETNQRRHQNALGHPSRSIQVRHYFFHVWREIVEKQIRRPVFELTQKGNDVFVERNGLQQLKFVVENVLQNLVGLNAHVENQFQSNISNAFG